MRHLAMPALAAVAVLALAGCGGSDDKADSKPSAAPSSTPSTPAAPAIPSPDAAQTKALMGKLSAIKPELAADEERAVRRAQNVCSDVRGGKDDATMAKNANYRFSGGTAGQLTDAQGAKIVDAVKASFCK
ncbi:hypothetical protein SEA_EURATIS_51 [Streptomyces phage Euratis]|uniref:DUF732 domain-containing protein n=1 Tax=Streptomyces phage Euratis TaxID=2510569 RepID=A0A411B129_9CAUD|nr:hypothetical protein SEA_EURATIS_51 [Streptomyces phage Euratis]